MLTFKTLCFIIADKFGAYYLLIRVVLTVNWIEIVVFLFQCCDSDADDQHPVTCILNFDLGIFSFLLISGFFHPSFFPFCLESDAFTLASRKQKPIKAEQNIGVEENRAITLPAAGQISEDTKLVKIICRQYKTMRKGCRKTTKQIQNGFWTFGSRPRIWRENGSNGTPLCDDAGSTCLRNESAK